MPALLHLAPAHGHLVYAPEQLVRGDGLRGAELYASVPAYQDRLESLRRNAVSAPGVRGVGCPAGQVLDTQITLRNTLLRTRQKLSLPGEGGGFRGGREDEQPPGVLGEAGVQPCVPSELFTLMVWRTAWL